MEVEKLLRYAGMFLIVAAILGGIIGWASIDTEAYDSAKEVYEELYDNEFAEASYNAAHTVFISQISILITSVIGTLIGGLLVLGFGKMIEIQKLTVETLKNTNESPQK